MRPTPENQLVRFRCSRCEGRNEHLPLCPVGQEERRQHDRDIMKAIMSLNEEKEKLERERDGAVERILPKEPPPGLLMSMAIRFDHALGIPGYYDQPLYAAVTSHDQRLRATIGQMRQLYEEVSGHGFYQPESEEKYAAMIPPKALAGEEGKR